MTLKTSLLMSRMTESSRLSCFYDLASLMSGSTLFIYSRPCYAQLPSTMALWPMWIISTIALQQYGGGPSTLPTSNLQDLKHTIVILAMLLCLLFTMTLGASLNQDSTFFHMSGTGCFSWTPTAC